MLARRAARSAFTPRGGQGWAAQLRSSAGENRLALFHECSAAFGEVVAGEARLHHFDRADDVALAFVLEDLADGVFHRLDGERRVGADQVGDGLDGSLEL